MKKTLYRLVDNLFPRVITVALFVVTTACCLNAIQFVAIGNYNQAALFGFITFLLGVLTDQTYKALWTPRKSNH